MKANNELERSDIVIDRDFDVNDDNKISVYIETWFDMDKKFGLHINDEDGTWLNMFGNYNPFEDTLTVECEISRYNSSECFDYVPTVNESLMIKDMIAERIREECGCSPPELCERYYGVPCYGQSNY